MSRSAVFVVTLIVILLGSLILPAYAQEARRTGEITKIDAASKSFMVKTTRGETNIVTTSQTAFTEGGKAIKFDDLQVGDNVEVTGERKGSDVEAKEVVKAAPEHEHMM